LRTNHTKAKLKAGQPVYGCFIRSADANLVELIAGLGFDFLVFDAEHGAIEPRDCENLVRAAELRGVSPLIRVTANTAPVILRFADTGAQGIQVPWVNSVADAESAVRAVKYSPRGTRGLATTRAADFGQKASISEYVAQANAETLVIAQIEGSDAVDQASGIARVEDIDVVFIGPTDLSNSLGHPGNPAHPEVQAAMDRIIADVEGANAALGIFVPNAQAARAWRERGARYIATSLEPILTSSIRNYLDAVRGDGKT
jgi:4-hydroxy-2-oxoheptanedioate aldolase